MGTSVNVAKYISAPVTDANKLVHSGQIVASQAGAVPSRPRMESNACGESPTSAWIQRFGMMPASWLSGLPRKNPAASTPMKRRGRICLAKPHDWSRQSLSSAPPKKVSATRPADPAANAATGCWGRTMANAAAGTAANTM